MRPRSAKRRDTRYHPHDQRLRASSAFFDVRRPRRAAGPFLCVSSGVRWPPEVTGPSSHLSAVPRDGPGAGSVLSETSACFWVDSLHVAAGPLAPRSHVQLSCPAHQAGEALDGACESLSPVSPVRPKYCRAVRRADRCDVSSPFGLTRPLRPRFGMSIRRPSFATLRLDLKTATAVLGFLPLVAARPFLARQESLARPSSTALRPFG